MTYIHVIHAHQHVGLRILQRNRALHTGFAAQCVRHTVARGIRTVMQRHAVPIMLSALLPAGLPSAERQLGPMCSGMQSLACTVHG